MYQIVTTSDGSHTIYVPELDEHYHSIYGAVQEAEFIFIRNGFDFCTADPLYIFEVGFGTGLNALLTAIKCLTGKREVFYTSIERYPLSDNIISSLNYHLFTGNEGRKIFQMIHSAGWNKMVSVCKNFNIRKINADLLTCHPEGSFNLIYFDAFGPDKQPEMWTRQVFNKIAGITSESGILITYSVKGLVKRNLRACGFDVRLLPGPPGKRQILSAIKK